MAHILIVDDDKSIRISVSTILREAGLNVETAEDAEVAIDLIATRDFDVVLSNIYLPHVNGTDFLKSIRKASPNIQVILMTDPTRADAATDVIRASAFDYIKKPITKVKITRVVRNAVRIKTLDDERRRLEEENKGYQKSIERLLEEQRSAIDGREDKSRTSVNSIPDFIYTINRNHSFTFYHSSSNSDLDLLPDDFVGKKIIDVLPTVIANKTIESFETVMNSKEEDRFEYSLKIGRTLHIFESCMVPKGENEVLVVIRELQKRKTPKKD